jgi:signal transduction histidine kinase
MHERLPFGGLAVGVGASAGGPDALERLFGALPADTGAAFVVVQHLSPDHKSMMDKLLARYTAMPVRVAVHDLPQAANAVFLVRPAKNMRLAGERQLLSLKPDHGLSLPIDIFFGSLAGQELPLALAAPIAQQLPLNLELQRAMPDGGERWLHVTRRAHADAQGRVVRVIGCAWDSSPEHESLRLRAAEEAAKEAAESAHRAKSAFLSRMSHELRTPLNAILGFSQLMRREAEAGDLVLKPHRVTLIEGAARHLLDRVNEVLDVSRIEAGRVELRLMRCVWTA